MDPAVIGYMRIGHFRIGVKKPDFDRAITRLEKISAKSMGGKDPAIVGKCRVGYCRVGVKVPLFDAFVQRTEKV